MSNSSSTSHDRNQRRDQDKGSDSAAGSGSEATHKLTRQAQVLGAFVDASLLNAGSSRGHLAEQLQMDAELLDALLDGILPDEEIDDQTLIELAQAIDYEPNVLRILLGRSVVSGNSAD